MKTEQRALIVRAYYSCNESPTLLNSYLDDGWKVVSITPFARFDSSEQKMLVVIEREKKTN